MNEPNEVENYADENIYGLLGDLAEWAMYETVPALFLIILLVERFAREAIVQWGNYKARKYDGNP